MHWDSNNPARWAAHQPEPIQIISAHEALRRYAQASRNNHDAHFAWEHQCCNAWQRDRMRAWVCWLSRLPLLKKLPRPARHVCAILQIPLCVSMML